jgi:hypothetical protein
MFQELAEYRQQLGLPSASSEDDNSTIAKLEMGDLSFFGINSELEIISPDGHQTFIFD